MIIKLELVSMSRQKVIEQRLYELDLGEKAFTLQLKFKAEEPQEDDALP